MQNLLSNRLVPSLALSLGAATAQAETPIALPDMEVSTWGNSLSPPDSVAAKTSSASTAATSARR